MADTQKDFLLALIKSLTRSEKRQFRLYVNRLGINADAKFLLLFDIMDKMPEYDEARILEKKITTKQQLSNLKAHLYKQILISLRTNPSNQNIRIMLREQLDFATILYNRGLYKQSLKLLDKTKQTALNFEEKVIAYEIVEFEKVIESQYITRSIGTRADDLIADTENLSELNTLNSRLSNLSLKLYSNMLANGYAKSDAEKEAIDAYFYDHLPRKGLEIMGFRELLWYYKAHVWKNQLQQNTLFSYKYALKWVQLFYANPEMISSHPVWFIKGNSYLLNALFLLRRGNHFKHWLHQFETTLQQENFPKNDNTEAVAFTVLYNAKLNVLFLEGNYSQARKLIKEILAHKEFHDDKIDEHHIFILNFKIASTYFGEENYLKCISELEKIIHKKNSGIRDELYFHSHILAIMAMMDSGADETLEEMIEETLRFEKKMKQNNQYSATTAALVQDLWNAFPGEHRGIAQKYLKIYHEMLANPYNARSFVYLDLVSWLEAKVQNRKMTEVIRKKSV